mmetsp:Transcript_26660/g.65869  ORF Transcript_26660/g.65869 Transcript_26660/m.65869 type:complete len:109 (-) Transcript_26660:357-683(-)
MDSAADPAQDVQLPEALGWAISLLEPGTRPEVFTFFKGVVVALVLCLTYMLFGMDMPADVIIHLKVFLGLSVTLMFITFWFFGELQAAQAAEKAEDAAKAAAEAKKEK